MTCDCFEKLKEALNKMFGEVKIDSVVKYDLETGEETRIPFPIYFSYYPKKSNGELYKIPKRSYLMSEYCPMCGKKYEGD